MKGLTMTQPWASLVAIGENRIETRSWRTGYRGPIAIHAAKAFPPDARRLCRRWPYRETLAAAGYPSADALPVGAVIAVAELEDVMAFDPGSLAEVRARVARGELPAHDADFCDFSSGRFGFVLRDVRRLATPVPARGMLGVWAVPADLEQRIMAEAARG
jgi:activating signal cointegrator 1